MFRTLQNTATLAVTLVPDGPILIRAQSVGIDPGLADMEFQRTHRNGRSTVFLAGSGLKGVLRSHSERLLRSAGRFACDPTQIRDEGTCGKRKIGPPQLPNYPHAGQCGACFTFGSLALAGRFRIGDAYPAEGKEEEDANRTEVRTGVGIDRRSQAAAHGVLYEAEVVVGGAFRARINGENFSLWQLGLILAALQDLDSGLVHIGGAKARGMGSVRVRDWSVELGFLNKEDGIITGAKPAEGDLWRYGLPSGDKLTAPPGGQSSRRGIFRTLRYEGEEAVQALATRLGESSLQRYLEGKG
ncbi:MAG TPA: RAMP superfamily CRISPR-associated protein [Thermoanaerobaculia bacterium]|jgi:CRISPR-associated RAMP protein (TIGR02581 family)|nr:RAMP superfamily CRISPR-associated protein [Thermoanaerobaculia bacterium]